MAVLRVAAPRNHFCVATVVQSRGLTLGSGSRLAQIRSRRYFFRSIFVFPLVKWGLALFFSGAVAPQPCAEGGAARSG